ncbi:MAG: hypothetical protein VCD00_20010 [Candidatus Hydrogenedentota bacterium]
MKDISRRRFLHGTTGAMLAGSLTHPWPFPSVHAEDIATAARPVQFSDELEPIVRLIENTPRDKAIEVLAHQVQNGLSYDNFLGAMFLAGIRNVDPQPPGFKFHCVFIIHSCNYLAQMGPPEERFVPLFYALDDFKKAQANDVREGDFTLLETTGSIPAGAKAWAEFDVAMKNWDEARADRAITGLARSETPERIFEGLWEYGARDYRNIGHKIIFVAHAWRTLEQIGFQHMEAVLRSLVLGLLDFGQNETLNGFAFKDQTYRTNRETVVRLAGSLLDGWTGTKANSEATQVVVDSIREGDRASACNLTATMVASGKCEAQAVWDAIHLISGELMMRKPGIAGVHTVTSSNAMHFAFRTSKNPQTKLLLLLQGVGWMGQFQEFMLGNDRDGLHIENLEPTDISTTETEAVEQILETISTDPTEAATLALAYGNTFKEPALYFDAARHQINRKATEHHMVKWPAAIFEDYHHISPQYRPQLLATSVYYLRGTGHRDSPILKRAIDASRKV